MEKTLGFQEINVVKPDPNDIKALIEYQNIYHFYIQKITTSSYDHAYLEATTFNKFYTNR